MFWEGLRFHVRWWAAILVLSAIAFAAVARAETAIVEATLDHRIYIGQGRTLQLAKQDALDGCKWAGYENCRIVWVCEQRGWMAVTRFQSKDRWVWGASCGHATRAEADHAAVSECSSRTGSESTCSYPFVEYFEEGSQEVPGEGQSLLQQCRGACAGDCASGLRACMCFQQCEREGVDRIWPLFLPTDAERQYMTGERQ